MSSPRAVVVHRTTELDELVSRHGTRGQAEFFLASRGRRLADLQDRHDRTADALATVSRAIPVDWRRASVERSELARFLFGPDDVVLVVGQDGLVANVAKYLDGQAVIGIDPLPGVNAGVLVQHQAAAIKALLTELTKGASGFLHRTMIEAVADDGQVLRALNEVYVGQPTQQTARYSLSALGSAERQASSGLIVASGTGATGWAASIHRAQRSTLSLPAADAPAAAFFVREPWPSPTTGTSLTEGLLAEPLELTIESDTLVAFGDGIEDDRLILAAGQTVRIGVSQTSLHQVV